MFSVALTAEDDEKKSDENSNEAPSEKNSEDGSGLLTHSKSGKKKKNLRVSWAAEANLRQFHYFELDETERGWCHLLLSVAAFLLLC